MLTDPSVSPLAIRPSTQPRRSAATTSEGALPTLSKNRRSSSRYALRVFSARLTIVICSSARSSAAEIVMSPFIVMVFPFPPAARARTIRTRTADKERNSTVREREVRRDREFGPQRPSDATLMAPRRKIEEPACPFATAAKQLRSTLRMLSSTFWTRLHRKPGSGSQKTAEKVRIRGRLQTWMLLPAAGCVDAKQCPECPATLAWHAG